MRQNCHSELSAQLASQLLVTDGVPDFKMVLEDQRFIHEDLERLEQAIADRVAEEPRNVSLTSSNTVSWVSSNCCFYRSENVYRATMKSPSS